MLIYRIGDLIQAPEPILIHGCNAQGKMNSGVAKAIREAYPEAYRVYLDAYTRSWLGLGVVYWATTSDNPPKIIGNGITQEFYGRDGSQYVSYEAVASVFQEVHSMITEAAIPFNISQPLVAIPRIGAGLGGGRWGIIADIIEAEMKELDVVVYDLA